MKDSVKSISEGMQSFRGLVQVYPLNTIIQLCSLHCPPKFLAEEE